VDPVSLNDNNICCVWLNT